MKTTDKFVFFYGGPFSQWYSQIMIVDGVTYCTAEQYMMAMKADYFNDQEAKEKIMKTADPSEQKAIGRMVKGFDAEAWNAVSRGFVYKGNMAKFRDSHLKRLLLGTGNRELVEASPYDRVWGIGLAENNRLALDKANWRGTNWLGEVLMKVRSDICKEKSND